MEVRCERCNARYAVDDGLVDETGLAVRCSKCGHTFRVQRTPRGWRVRGRAGDVYPVPDSAMLQRWVVEGRLKREDEVSADGGPWTQAGKIKDLEPFFAVVDQARRPGSPPATQPAREPATRAAAGPRDLHEEPTVGVGLEETPSETWEVPVTRPEGAQEPAWAAAKAPVALEAREPGRRSAPGRGRGSPWPWILLALVLIGAAGGVVLLVRPGWLPLDSLGLRSMAPPANGSASPTQGGGEGRGEAAVATPAPAPSAVPPAATAPTAAKPPPASPSPAAPEPQHGAPSPPPTAPEAPHGSPAPPHDGEEARGEGANAALPPAPAQAAPAPEPPKVTPEPQQPNAAPEQSQPSKAAAPEPPHGSPSAGQEQGAVAPPATAQSPATSAAEPAIREKPAPAAAKPERRPATAAERRVSPEVRKLRALLADARRARDRGRADAALDLYGRALQVEPANADALAGQGLCYLDLSQYGPAEKSFQSALQVDANHGAALMGLAETYRYEGRNADAVTYYRKYLAAHPSGEDAAAARNAMQALEESQ